MKKASILLIVVLAFSLRIWGNHFGLPTMLVHSDENEYVSAVKSIIDHTPSPYKVGLPKSSFYYLLLGVYSFFRAFVENSKDITDFFSFGRTFSAILSTLTVLLWYKTVKNLWSQKYALWASLLLSLFLIDVQIAHYIKEDVYVQFFGVASLYYLSRSYYKESIKSLFVAIIFALLAGSAKINGFVYSIPLGLYLLMGTQGNQIIALKNILRPNNRKLLLVLLCVGALFTFYINTPISFMDSAASKKYSLDAILSPEHEGLVMSTNQDGIANIFFWPLYLTTTGIGYFIILMIGIGIFSLLTKEKAFFKKLAPFWIMTVMVYLLLSIQTQRFDRWITMITPQLALLGAIGIVWLSQKLPRKLFMAVVPTGLIFSAAIVFLFCQGLQKPDPRFAVIDHLKQFDKKTILLFLPGLDPVKHTIVKEGYIIKDIPCPPLDPTDYAGMYFIKNDTLFEIYRRFHMSDFYSKQVSCIDNLVSHSNLVQTFDGGPLDTPLFGWSKMIGPATIRYLHAPKVSLFKIHQKRSSTISYTYTPERIVSMSTNMILSEGNQAQSIPGSSATIGGPYIVLPEGKYVAHITFSYKKTGQGFSTDIMSLAFTNTFQPIGQYKVLRTSQFSQQTTHTYDQLFELSRPSQLQTNINIPDSILVNIYTIKIEGK